MRSKLYTRGERIFKWVSLVLLLVIDVYKRQAKIIHIQNRIYAPARRNSEEGV